MAHWKTSSYILTVQAADMGGEPGGLTGTSTMMVHILDVNDIVPKLEKDEFSVSIDENVEDVEVMRFKALDDDLRGSDNWLAVFHIVSGNEDDYFSVYTDPRTNEGVLMLKKAVDFEAVPNLNLGVVVMNQAPEGARVPGYAGGSGGAGGGGGGTGGPGGVGWPGGGGGGPAGVPGGTGTLGKPRQPGTGGTWSISSKYKSYPVKVSVNNKPDGAVYRPSTKPISLPEGKGQLSIPKVICTFPATDGDSGEQAQNVRYAKGYDPGNWFTIDEETAEITLNKMPDRESPYVVNGTYLAKILCMTNDMPTQTATGTIAVHVEDTNDNCPTLTSHVQYLCSDTKVVNVTAEDLDGDPNGPPLEFTLLDEGVGVKWRLQQTGDASAALWAEDGLWPGLYEVTFEIRDKQGLACPDRQVLKLEVCTCQGGLTSCALKQEQMQSGVTSSKKSSELGGAAVGGMLLGLLALLLVPLMALFCSCGGTSGLTGGFTDLPFDGKTHLISYHTEGKGEDREVPLMSVPVLISKVIPVTASANMATTTMVSRQMQENAFGGFYDYDEPEMGNMDSSAHWEYTSDLPEMREEDQLSFMALPDTFLDHYFSQKAEHTAVTSCPKDNLLVYEYEGQGSPANSVGCCSLLESEE
ncbi:desmoglein-2-like [Clupea harengus]|uniref:Desmoglein-2-like n=1 Tax=Clupea harengus TaxID=7950 RepID=A0A6P8G5W0_CLUHA|nr:desmoglein-2-like [Clupea harengus]